MVSPDPIRLTLPPAFTGRVVPMPDDAFAHACRIAGPDTTGTLVLVARDDLIDLAVVLAPEEPLASARRAVFAGMVALAEGIGAQAPPEVPVVIAWPDTLLFDGARLGGGRLGWPQDCAEDSVPDWLVFSGLVIANKRDAGDPGLTPDSTSLEEEGFGVAGHAEIVEGFARHLMKAFEVWEQDGFGVLADRYLAHVPIGADEERRRIEANGDGVIAAAGRVRRLELLPALRVAAWLDPATGKPRL